MYTKVEKYFDEVLSKIIKTKDHLEIFLNNPEMRKKFNEGEIEELRELFITYCVEGEGMLPDLKDELLIWEDIDMCEDCEEEDDEDE